MKTKCKPVPSQTVQLQIHPGLVSKAEDVKSLVWLIPFLWGDVLHCASLYTYTKLLHETHAPQAFSCHSNTIQVTKITSVPTQLDPCREKTSFAFSFLHWDAKVPCIFPLRSSLLWTCPISVPCFLLGLLSTALLFMSIEETQRVFVPFLYPIKENF